MLNIPIFYSVNVVVLTNRIIILLILKLLFFLDINFS